MSQEKYQPSEEEIKRAEDSMTRRQESFSSEREEIFSQAESLGVSRDALINSTKDSRGTGILGDYYTINGHTILFRDEDLDDSNSSESLLLDQRGVFDAKQREKLLKLGRLLYRFHDQVLDGQSSEVEALIYKHGITDDQDQQIMNEYGVEDGLNSKLNKKAMDEIFS